MQQKNKSKNELCTFGEIHIILSQKNMAQCYAIVSCTITACNFCAIIAQLF